MSGPALYTYFASLVELFTELIVDSYRSLAADVAAAVEAVAERDLGERLRAGPIAYRRWGIEHRQQFNLVFFDQIVGYTAPPDGPTVDAQTEVLRPIANEYATARGVALDDVERDDELLDEFLAWWGAFHGIVALEVNHHLDWRNPEVIFHRHLDRSVATLTEG